MKNEKELTLSTQGQVSEPVKPSSIFVSIDLSKHEGFQELKNLLQVASDQLDALNHTLDQIESYRPKI